MTRPREFYQLRRYSLQSGPQARDDGEVHQRGADSCTGVTRGGPVGAFRLDIGPETPTFYVLIPIAGACDGRSS